MTWDVVVIGAGAAGLLAAIRAAERGKRTLLVEKNDRPGVKILMSGGNRCNVTHATDRRGIVKAFGAQGNFLHSALAALGPEQVVQLLESEGVRTKVEENGKVFPASDRAADVLRAFLQRLRRSGAVLGLDEPASHLGLAEGAFRVTTTQRLLEARAVILTTGGMSYPACGTRGDGYAWASAVGHTIVAPRPALTPVVTDASWIRDLRGVTLPDVAVTVVPRVAGQISDVEVPSSARKPLAAARGSFLFTHFGLSGPVVLDVSRAISGCARPETLDLCCDFSPDASEETLSRWLDEQCSQSGSRQIGGLLGDRFLRRFGLALATLAGVSPEQRAAELGRRGRRSLLAAVKQLRVPIRGVMGFRKAEVTAGGVSLDEVDSRTMQSRRVPGLYFAGEILDLDGPIGGYNFQAAFSTGWLAGSQVA